MTGGRSKLAKMLSLDLPFMFMYRHMTPVVRIPAGFDR